MTIKELFDIYFSVFSQFCSVEEAKNSAYILVEDLYGVRKIDVLVSPTQTIEIDETLHKSVIDRLNAQTPIQYITGKAEFCGREFYVENGVLIPRPETQELVDMIISENNFPKNILDIGTGSGVIAVSLAKYFVNSSVCAFDVSPKALNIARINADKFGCINLQFELVDILQTQSLDKSYDIIVSNPPYITISEQKFMRPNVMDYEPHLALFVPDNDPLVFYRKISELAFGALSENGALYFEINEAFGEQTIQMIKNIGFSKVELIKDIFDKNRMIRAKK